MGRRKTIQNYQLDCKEDKRDTASESVDDRMTKRSFITQRLTGILITESLLNRIGIDHLVMRTVPNLLI